CTCSCVKLPFACRQCSPVAQIHLPFQIIDAAFQANRQIKCSSQCRFRTVNRPLPCFFKRQRLSGNSGLHICLGQIIRNFQFFQNRFDRFYFSRVFRSDCCFDFFHTFHSFQKKRARRHFFRRFV